MSDFSESACFLKLLRPPSKSIKHAITGKSQIERVSLSNDHRSLEYSIRHSKMLESYKNNYSFQQPFKPEQTSTLFKAKNITGKENQFYVIKLLRELHCYEYTVHFIEEKRKKKYNKNNEEHEKKLLAIWSELKPDEKLKKRVTEQWISIGFQVEDPATDFRGAGQLGLQNLYRFSETEKAKKLFQIASIPQTQYFYCSAGLYLTMTAVQMLKSRKCIQHDFWINESEEQLMNNFQIVYETLFEEFSKYWLKQCGNKSIMYFNQNLKNFEKRVSTWSPSDFKKKVTKHRQ